ncbi:putative RNA recognition motif domain, nucleotide-binding alpha-beta plait domain superfamily [Helianthus annuus]|uniref:RNA recognition motif domain, nucleotide-binding alpha-beta plait domain superfamily n=1 Tax=Helianthus annuus TaxID=4232 RepID=A0A9K3IFW2_HELAN|nr:putative RNA recognition motif domain, nucleotide-binding alpha-beta plait domain superfamily [Helianthus annuus]KAJ0547549.1 putative RNA recognition motif domain, nucleotide-binding alpha-beta plait domain superfamily [Helianthus annuus]KAJ0554107.1 putative RNA recognition motif domain, nucleotide-binding alpha-beta plait domain superfamily [Helianthus annuus]KAJ0719713.1 putative RNA recognition motif domain, nucleotide-binding alpha-beta plait domain superfamily [Helianthus annuus]KAJ08
MSGDSRQRSSEEWQDVPSRKGRRNSQQGGANNKIITKFYVSNLPPKCSSLDLKEVFGGFGVYEGSYIARKRDRWGKRFAFVSFRDVHDVKRLEGEMVDVWVGSYKLFVALARFVDGDMIDKPKPDLRRKAIMKELASHANHIVEGEYESGANTMGRGDNSNQTRGGRSFLDSVLNRNKVDTILVDDNVEGFYQWHGMSLVGKVVDFNTLTSLKELLRSRGWNSVAIKYVGGFSVLLVFTCLEDAESFLSYKNMWSVWFEGLKVWDGNFKEEERIAWLKVYGVPVQLAVDQVLEMVGSRYGKVVQPARMSGDDNNFSFAFIGVLTKSCSRIVDRVDIRWRGFLFNVWTDEDVGSTRGC